MIIREYLGKDNQLIHLYSDEARKLENITNGNLYTDVYTRANNVDKYRESDETISDEEYVDKFSLAEKITKLENLYKKTEESNNMLTECILEISDILYS